MVLWILFLAQLEVQTVNMVKKCVQPVQEEITLTAKDRQRAASVPLAANVAMQPSRP